MTRRTASAGSVRKLTRARVRRIRLDRWAGSLTAEFAPPLDASVSGAHYTRKRFAALRYARSTPARHHAAARQVETAQRPVPSCRDVPCERALRENHAFTRGFERATVRQQTAGLIEGGLRERPGAPLITGSGGVAQWSHWRGGDIQAKNCLAIINAGEDRSRNAERDRLPGKALPCPAVGSGLEQTRNSHCPTGRRCHTP
jgi:hypothetical protein